MKIRLLYGTETGSAEILCDDLKSELDGDVSCEIVSMEHADPTELSGDALNVFVVSTTGAGDLPFTAIPFCEKLDTVKPDLSAASFAIFGLGDMTFEATFNEGSAQVMAKLLACNAVQVGERGIFDAAGTDMPEEVALPWLRKTLESMAVA